MSVQTEISVCVVANITTDLDYAYTAKVCDDEISLSLVDAVEDVGDLVVGTVTFGSIEEMRAVALAMLKLADTVDPK